MTETFSPAGPDRWSVLLTRHYPHPAEKVWQAVSRPEHLAAWFPSSISFDGGEPRVGSPVRFGEPMAGSPALTGVVTDYDPPRLLGFTWATDHVRLELSPAEGGTDLVLLHTFGDRAGAASFASGWAVCLGALAADLGGEPAPERSRAERRHEALAAAFGLDAPAVDEVDDTGRWHITFERQMVAPADIVWGLALGAGSAARGEFPAPAVGEPFTPWAAPDSAPVTVTEVVESQLLAWSCSPDEPGDAVRVELVEGTGHGGRLHVTVTGSTPDERALARERWHGRVAGTAAEALDWALAETRSGPS